MVDDRASMAAAPQSPWAPLRHPAFRSLWLAVLVANVGTWMQNVGAGWLMTDLTDSPLLVALVQAATSLPAFLAALPAGALADLVDRRRLLMATQAWMLAAALVLAGLTAAGQVTPAVLLALTFALGLGQAVYVPGWQASVPELVPAADLPQAVALGSVSFNAARAIGPALGGVVIALSGPEAVFALNAVSCVAPIVAFARWRRPPAAEAGPVERLGGAVRAGLRYVRNDPPLLAVLGRAALFVLGSGALWGLLPQVAAERLGLGSGGYGLLLACLGAGAIAAATVMPRLRARLTPDALASAATVVFAGATLALAFADPVPVVCVALLLGGGAWLTTISACNVSVQRIVPAWVRARALSVYGLTFSAGLAGGAALWGTVAALAGTRAALAGAAGFLLVTVLAAPRLRLPVETPDVSPSPTASEPVLALVPAPDDGPVLVTVEYRVTPADAPAFAAAMAGVRLVRRRDGAVRWGLYRDGEDPDVWLEAFVVESWSEHLRQHARATVADVEVRDAARRFHRGDDPPRVRHLLGGPAAGTLAPAEAGPDRALS
jgi:MFS family permease